MTADSPQISNVKPQASAVVLALTFPTLLTWVYFVALADQPASRQQTVYGFGKLMQFGFPIAWVLAWERQRPRWPEKPTSGLFNGMLFGLVISGTTLGLYHGWMKPAGWFDAAMEAVRLKVTSAGITSPGKYIALGVFYSAAHSLMEEYYWRWFVFGRARRLLPLGAAIAISSLGFMAHHVIVLSVYFGWSSFATWFFSFSVAVGGAVLAWLYQRSGSLLGPWLSHALVDAGVFLIGYDLLRATWLDA